MFVACGVVVVRRWFILWGLACALFSAAGPTAATADIRRLATSVAYAMTVTVPGQPPVRLHIEESGRGPPLVLLHGMGGSGYSFRHVVAPLGRSHRVITIDLKGFGASDKPFDTAYGPADQAQLVAAVLRLRRLTGVTLAGHSFGGAVALLTTLDLNRHEPGRIRRLILMNTPAYPQPLPRTQHLLTLPVLSHLALALVPPILNTRAALQTPRRRTPPASDQEAIVYAEPLYEAGGRHALIATARAIAAADGRAVTPFYRTIRQPTQLIWCRHDPTVPLATGVRLAQALPHVRLAVLDQCGHMPAEEDPLGTIGIIKDFLSGRG